MAGIGEISPIKIKLTRENFNALIGRHAQPIRWLSTDKCSCIGDNQRVDESCTICKGKGVIYSTTTESERIETIKASIDGYIAVSNIIWVRDMEGTEYTVTEEVSTCGAFVTGVERGKSYNVKYTEDVTLSGTATATRIADGIYSIDLPYQVSFGYVQGELISVTAVTGSTTLTVTDIYRNCFEISDEILSSDVVSVTYTYIDPFQFALTSSNFQPADRKFLADIGGDALLTFPQRWEIFKDDIIVALNATELKKLVYRTTALIDSLPSFYLYTLKSAHVIRSGVKIEFTPYTDFYIYKNNQIKWINPPIAGESVSMTYSYNTVYKVLDYPDPRTSENNRFPRKVPVKLFTDFNSRGGF